MRLAHRPKILSALCLYFLLFSLLIPTLQGQDTISAPKEFFGHNIGDDYFLATYTRMKEYWDLLARESGRMILQEVGTT